MPYKDIRKKRSAARVQSKSYYHSHKNDPGFKEDRHRRHREWAENNREHINDYMRGRAKTHPPDKEKIRIWSKKTRENYRNKLFEVYGSICNCCGEPERLFLTLDHVDGGGSKDFRTHGSFTVYKRAIKDNDKSKWQILCWNCNHGKFLNNGVCPHKLKKE